MMRLGFVSAILPEESLESVFRIAADVGYDCVEVMCWPVGKATRRYAGITHIDVDGFSASQAAEVRALTQRYGVQISGLGYYPNPLAPDNDESRTAVEHLKKVIVASAELGLGRVNTFVGRDPAKSVEKNWPKFLDTWQPLIEFAQQHCVKIGIENCPMLFTEDEWPGGKNLAHSPVIWRKMFESIPSDHFGLNYDPSHMVFQQMDYLAPMRDFASRLFHIHAKDVRVDQHKLDQVGTLAYPNLYHTPKLPGLGEVDWGRFFSVLGDAGYRGPVCVEVEDRIYEGSLENRILALRQSHDYLRQFVPKP
jgi:sugar phosphate isomerase/epimerase